MVLQIFKISASHLDARSLVHHSSRKLSAVTRDSRKYNYILIRFDINYSQIVFPPGCEKLSVETGGKNYYDFAETKTLQFNSFNTKASFTMKLYRYNVNDAFQLTTSCVVSSYIKNDKGNMTKIK